MIPGDSLPPSPSAFLGHTAGGFVAVGADKGIGEEDVAGHPEAIAAQGAFGVTVELGPATP